MKSYIWSFPTRAFHWLLALGFVLAWLSGDFEYLRNLHYAFGAYAGALLLLRLFYGFFGPPYSRFADFPMGWKQQKEYLLSLRGRVKEYAGHNPVASLIMLLMILSGIAAAISGYIYYANLAKSGGLTLNIPSGNFHHLCSTAFLILVLIHLAGLIADVFKRRHTGNLRSMFTGYKPLEAAPVDLTTFQKVYAVIWMLLPFLFFFLAYRLPV